MRAEAERVDVHLWFHFGDTSPGLLSLVQRILDNQGIMMSTLDEVLSDVQSEGTVVDGISTLITGLQQQLKDALAGTTLPAGVQAKIDAVFSAVEANKAKLASALVSGTPAPSPAPAPTPAPSPVPPAPAPTPAPVPSPSPVPPPTGAIDPATGLPFPVGPGSTGVKSATNPDGSPVRSGGM